MDNLTVSEALKELNEENLFEMANIRGKYIKIEDLDFSFYYGSKYDVNKQHGIRVKISWNRDKISLDLLDGYLELHGDYKYISTAHPNYKPDAVDIATARYFFKRYKVLFAAVWEGILDENIMSDFLRENISLKETILNFENIDNKLKILLSESPDTKTLEKLVREYNIFNLND